MSATHELKCWPEQFAAIESGEKTFEYRRNDRDYQVGDTLIIFEWDPDEDAYTGKELARTICHILAEGFGLPEGYAVLGLWVDPEQLGMSAIGQSVMNWIDELTQQEGPLKDWTPAESPAEIIPDLYNMLEESLACHRQACGETQKIADKMLELADAIKTAADGIGKDRPSPLDILLDAVKIAKDAKTGKPIGTPPPGFCWINQTITVTGGDYAYEGQLLCSFPKDEENSAIRYIVRDQNRRLFIHNAQQCGLEATI
ncbi:ASCH/PUA domain-containing protein [Rhizobium anhuiense]